MTAKLTLVVIGDFFGCDPQRSAPFVVYVAFQSLRCGFHDSPRSLAATFGAGADIFVHDICPNGSKDYANDDNQGNRCAHNKCWVEYF